jgi:hypothetical protein
MKILLCAEHYAVASGRYMVNALKRMGHDVRSVGPNRGAQIWGMTLDEQYVWLAELPEKGWTPDLVIYADAHLDWRRFGSCPHVVYGVDNHVRDYAQYEADHFFLAHGHGARMGEDNVTWLPCGYDPVLFTPSPLAWEQRFYDVAHIGVMYNARAELIYALSNRGWRLAYGTGAVYDQYAAIYQNARISLIKSAAGDVAQRVWETAAMGCLLVMDECADAEALGLVNGENCLIYGTTEGAISGITNALQHPDDAQHIAAAGQAWAQPGTWDARLQVIIEWVMMKSGKAPKAESKEDDTRN